MNLIAIPTTAQGGLEAPVSEHFGHADAFTLVEVEDGQIAQVRLLENPPHGSGGCMAPVMLLKNAGVTALVAGGMGARPLSGLQQVGIEVFLSEGAQTVDQAVKMVTAGQARRFAPAQVCGGGGDCGQHGH